MIGVGVVGFGYWGPNLVRNFDLQEDSKVVAVSDLQEGRLQQVRSRYPNIETSRDYEELLANPAVDAVVVATPVSTHYQVAMAALRSGKHVLVEKPLASSAADSERLIEEAERRHLTLMVDHTFVYTGAVRKIKQLLDEERLGRLYYYDSVRVNLGLFQHDINVLWDLAVHDLAIMDYLINKPPLSVAATGMAHVSGRPEDIAYVTCYFENNFIAHFHVNWLAPVKVRRTLIGGDRQMMVYDDVEPSEKVKVYDQGITVGDDPAGVHKLLVSYRAGDVWAPHLDRTEALSVEASHFLDCIAHKKKPISDGIAGLRIVRILEAASISLADGGLPVALS